MSRVEAFKLQLGSKLNQLIKAPFWGTDQGIKVIDLQTTDQEGMGKI